MSKARERSTPPAARAKAERAEKLEGQSLLKAQEVAILLNVSLRTVWSLASAGRLKARKVGPKATRFRREDVQKLIERG